MQAWQHSITSITLENYKSIGGTVALNKLDGNFKLLGVCKEGGDRLLNPQGHVALSVIKPNPANNNIEIEYELRETTKTCLYIINLTG